MSAVTLREAIVMNIAFFKIVSPYFIAAATVSGQD